MASRINTTDKKYARPVLFEDVLDRIGSCGPAQIVILFSNISADICSCFSMFFFTLEGANPGFFCSGDDVDENYCPDTGCFNVTFREDYTTLTTEFELVCGRLHYMKTTTSIFFAGVLIGGMLNSLSDYVGRKKIMIASFLLVGLLQGSLGFVYSLEVYMGVKFFSGICTGCLCAISPHLTVEYLGIKWRKLVAITFGWATGYAILGIISLLIRPWRYLTFTLGAVSLFCGIVFAIVLPESSRWYIQQGRYSEALDQLNWVAKLNRKPEITDTEILKEIQKQGRGTQERRYNVMDMFGTKKYAVMTSVQFYAYFVTALIHYGLANEMSVFIGSFHINLIVYGIFNIAIRFTSWIPLEKLGRRSGFVIYLLPSVLMYFVIVILDLTTDVSPYVRTWIAIVSMATLGGHVNTLTIYVMETYPTLLRATAYGFHLTGIRIGGMIAPHISLLSQYHSWIPYVIFGVLGLSEFVLMVSLMPETKGQPLIENIHDLGKKNSVDGVDEIDDEKVEEANGEKDETQLHLVNT